MSDQQVFLSHAHADNALCEQYYRALMSRGYDVWFDRANLQGGSVLSQEIAQQPDSTAELWKSDSQYEHPRIPKRACARRDPRLRRRR